MIKRGNKDKSVYIKNTKCLFDWPKHGSWSIPSTKRFIFCHRHTHRQTHTFKFALFWGKKVVCFYWLDFDCSTYLFWLFVGFFLLSTFWLMSSISLFSTFDCFTFWVLIVLLLTDLWQFLLLTRFWLFIL